VSTSIGKTRRRRRYVTWLIAIAAIATVALGALLRTGGAAGTPPAGPDADAQAAQRGLRAQIGARVATILEGSSTVQHHDHGHNFREQGKVVCAVDPFGYEPADATTVAEVKTVYAHHLCAISGTSGVWNTSVRAAGPIVAQLSDPPAVRIVESGAGFDQRIRQMIPARYRAEAAGFFTDDAALADARQRFAAAEAGQR
jgi:hypothetical protein